MFRQINKENAFDEILNQIIENIRAGRLKKGDALPAERAMAEAMGVSRPVIREVLRSLSSWNYKNGSWRSKLYFRRFGKLYDWSAFNFITVK